MKRLHESRTPLEKLLPLKSPLCIHIEITNKCNFKCVFCPESDPAYPDKVGGFATITSKQFDRIADQIAELNMHSAESGGEGVAVIRLWIMGEPLLNRDVFDIIKKIKDRRLARRVELTSNGSALTKQNSLGLIESGLDILKVSIYGFRERQTKITGTSISSEKILSNINGFLSARLKVGLTRPELVIKMVDPISQSELTEFKSTYASLADRLEVNVPHAWTEGATLNPNVNAIKQTVDKNERSFSVDHILNFKRAQTDIKLRKEKRVCAFPFYTLAIHVNGDVSPCCVDWEKKIKIGNINDESLSKIWNNSAMRELRVQQLTDLVPDGCARCDYYVENCPENLDDSASDLLAKFKHA